MIEKIKNSPGFRNTIGEFPEEDVMISSHFILKKMDDLIKGSEY